MNRNMLFLILLMCGNSAVKADIQLQPTLVSAGTTSGLDLVRFDLIVTGTDIGSFDTFAAKIDVTFGSIVADATPNTADTPLGQNFSGFSLLLVSPVVFGGSDLDKFGIMESSSSLSATFASLGGNRASELGSVFVAQAVIPSGIIPVTGTYQLDVFDDGNRPVGFVPQVGAWTTVPEPSMIPLFGLATAGVFGFRWWKSRKHDAA